MARKDRWLQKAEDWLAKRANAVNCWSNGEAIVYFLSRERRLTDQHQSQAADIRKHWHLERAEVERLIAKGRIVGTHPVTGDECPAPPRFWDLSSGKSAMDTLDATMMRVTEWLGIDGFDETWKHLASCLHGEAGMTKPSDESPAYHLFSLCRSSVALSKMPGAVNALLRALHREKALPARPWEITKHHPDEPSEDGYTGEAVKSAAIATSVAFAAIRCAADDITIGQQAQKFLIRQQGKSGAWPRIGAYLEDLDSILNTAMAVHALSLAKPRPHGTTKALERARAWLYKKQLARDGCWVEDGVDSVYLTVLVLDAIELAAGGDTVTLMLTESIPTVTRRLRKKAGRKPSVPKSAYAEIRNAYRKAETKSQISEVYDTLVERYDVSRDTISAIARKKKPYDK
jgi:hypothetical protein